MSARGQVLSEAVADLDLYELITRAAGGNAGSVLVHDEGLARIYGKSDLSLWAVVDPEDARYFSQWCWSYARSPWGKIYLCRRTTIGEGHLVRIDGKSYYKPGMLKTVYLHREILLRRGVLPPSPKHKIVDHRNGNSLDCRYDEPNDNLRWSTYKFNRANIRGCLADVECEA